MYKSFGLCLLALSALASHGRAEGGAAPPRRAFVIGVHDYLFANPVAPGESRKLVEQLSTAKGMRFPTTQVLHLSDAAANPRPPLKPVIEETLTRFLATSREQDRLFILFVGHAVAIEDKAYLMPIEGRSDVPETLIDLERVYQQLEKCKARQKVLVLDICRSNPSRGLLRPSMSTLLPGLKKALQMVPDGVQLWLACDENESSLELDGIGESESLFLDTLSEVLSKRGAGEENETKSSLPLERLRKEVNERMKTAILPFRHKQSSQLLGTEKKDGAAFNPREPAPPRPTVEGAKGIEGGVAALVRSAVEESRLPPFRKPRGLSDLGIETLPVFAKETMQKYPPVGVPLTVRQGIEKARVTLWGISDADPPRDLTAAVRKFRQSDEGIVILPWEGLRAPGMGADEEKRFKTSLLEQSRLTATVLRILEESLEELTVLASEREKLPPRWKAAFDYTMARTQMHAAFAYSYASALGSMRRELPELDPRVHGGWVLASVSKMTGDPAGRKLLKAAHKQLEQIIEDHPGTPWEVMARRDLLTNVGLEWVPRK